MPDFLLCNSKLTFQLTMTPEKTNYITQGADGVKRLKQGPDIASYRGLSIIHSRAFSLEVGQQPRDILRRRVRTAEYYRIPPHRDNYKREFELYTEERDGYFTLTFSDLLRMAMYRGSDITRRSVFSNGDAQLGAREGRGSYGLNNHARLQQAYAEVTQGQSNGPPTSGMFGTMPFALGAPLGGKSSDAELSVTEKSFVQDQMAFALKMTAGEKMRALMGLFGDKGRDWNTLRTANGHSWRVMPYAFDMDIMHKPPSEGRFPVWKAWKGALLQGGLPETALAPASMTCIPRLTPRMESSLFEQLRGVSLNHPFKTGVSASPGTTEWFTCFTFYQEVYRRHGVRMGHFHRPPAELLREIVAYAGKKLVTDPVRNARLGSVNTLTNIGTTVGPGEQMYIGDQFLSQRGLKGCVNHELQFAPMETFPNLMKRMTNDSIGGFCARNLILTYDLLDDLLREYVVDGATMTGLDYMENRVDIFEPVGDIDGVDPKLTEQSLMDVLRFCLSSCMANPMSILEFNQIILDDFEKLMRGPLKRLTAKAPSTPGAAYLAQSFISTWPMGVTTRSHLLHPMSKFAGSTPQAALDSDMQDILEGLCNATYGHLNRKCVKWLAKTCQGEMTMLHTHHFMAPVMKPYGSTVRFRYPRADDRVANGREWRNFWACIRKRIYNDPVASFIDVANVGNELSNNVEWRPLEILTDDGLEDLVDFCKVSADSLTGMGYPTEMVSDYDTGEALVDLNMFFKAHRAQSTAPAPEETKESLSSQVEFVIIRPNIEHNMLGVIMGLAGSELGYTLWGQTELSCYDDSMHGIWGMSYKYHERAVVFNERNLVRLWDIAYDGYNGGKDDTYVDWMNQDHPRNGLNVFRDATLDLGRSYRGPSMMVMAFVHDKNELGPSGEPLFDACFKRNWPSPIVFHDTHNPTRASGPANETLPLDYENLQVLDVSDFRVFNNPLYEHSYADYRAMMPAFNELHKMRKSAGQASAESETHTDSLAFQGSMRIKEGGRVLQDIQGSGHHGPDYVGIASVRAGKGIKYNGMAPALTHMV
jgi:hypothetical protein